MQSGLFGAGSLLGQGAIAARAYPLVLRTVFSGLFFNVGGFDVAGGRRHAMPGDRCVYAKTDGNSIYQLYTRTLPAGTETQLTSFADRHSAVPTFLPDGYRFVFQQETVIHDNKGVVGSPGDGWYHNLWLGNLDTAPASWTALTNVVTTGGTEGVLWPILDFGASDPAAIPVCYNWIYDRDTPQVHADYANGIVTPNTFPFGKCELRKATLNANTPALSGVTTIIAGPRWHEPQDWSGDKMIFCSERPQAGFTHHPHRIAIFSIEPNAADPEATIQQVSPGGDWDEFATYLPDGNNIIYMSSVGLGWDQNSTDRNDLRSRLWHVNLRQIVSRVNITPKQVLYANTKWRGKNIYTELHTFDAEGILTAIVMADAEGYMDPLPLFLATVNLPGARAAGNSWTATANFHLRYTVTSMPTAQSITLRVRQQDATNYWLLLVGTNGTLTLFETVAGTPTSRAVTGAVVGAGTIIDVIAWDNSIRLYIGGIWRAQYNAANNFKTQTAGNILGFGTGGGVSDLSIWEYVL